MERVNQVYRSKPSITSNKSIPILHIIKSLGRGGAETLLPETLSKHNQEKYCFHYIYFLPWKYQMVAAIESEGGEVTCLPAKDNFRIMLRVFKIVAYVKKHDIKLIHCHLPWAGIVGRIVGKLTGVPVVYTEHNTWDRYHKLTYYSNKLSFSSQKQVIAVSQEVAQSIKKNQGSNCPPIQVVLNGINTDKFSRTAYFERDIRMELNIPSDSVVIGITCVFRLQKRLDAWLEVARALHDQCPNTYFIVVGDGVLRDQVHEQAQVLNVQGYVHFVGMQSEIRPYLKAMDIFMMTSKFEGLPIALLEAMSMGCMPACTAAGGIPELITDEGNGILVPVSEPMELIHRLVAYCQQPSKISHMGRVARETVIANFSLKQMVGEIEDIYDRLIF
ncbi:MAG TPA: glycosyltransferase [Chitinophagaceae bacterium]|nr:glycosyltransferase [Chitinophagaceae bacterium]